MKAYIKGTYKKNIFKSDKGYVIGLFKIKETNDEEIKDFINRTVTITGYFHELSIDDNYIFYGQKIEHPRYGFQYEVKEYEKILPQDKEGIVLFLSSDLFKGIGEKQAETIVNTLGSDTLKKILTDKSCLYMVPKITEKKVESIYNTLTKYTESHETIVFLTELGFTMKDALTIYNIYKDKTKEKINQNIYNLITDLDGITFVKIDAIAFNLKILVNDIRRIKACILYTISNLVYNNGDTYLEYEEIYDSTCKYLDFEIDFDEFENHLASLVNEKKIFKDEYKYYLYDIYISERNIVNKIKKLLNKEKTIYNKLPIYIENLQITNDIIYNDKQKESITKALENNILIITGGPGTGKTTIIKAITILYQLLNKVTDSQVQEKISLLAPTGRASKRMSEATNFKAYTIHRYLKWNKDNNSFGINEYNKNKNELIIIDEVSMIDINLLDSLFKGLTDNIKLVLVGDYNQLPSVGPGQVLKDLIESKRIETIELDVLYRQNENSYINSLAHEIKNNSISNGFLQKHDDYNFLECTSNNLKNNIIALSKQLIDKNYDYKNVQFMAPLYRGENGIDNLNILLQSIFNPADESKKEIIYGDVIFRENDKILQLVNMPDDNIYNGDIGFISKIVFANKSESKKNEIYISFDGNIVKYETSNFNKIKHGYIISIHKSQGSEFEVVIIPIIKAYKRMLYKKLIYTGITRAKKKLILIGERESFLYSVENDSEQLRKTDLMNKLQKIS